ncbi:MAG: hypothetical protein VYB88_20350 [Pseudomonadota bacterium]|uniref:hypothetical protein n=1 Tax=Ralstonia pickettii TaxID=329 RepID=UPI001586C697|nr:hypothetical protein [Ralstonia pickettii]MEE2979821.1 hypothetical protein [Pseudomonadota bacterium]NWK43407.1 hypothetical protein [Ralstonia pickettii]
MSAQPGHSETDTTQPPADTGHPKTTPAPDKRKPGGPQVPRDTHPDPAEQNEPPVEDY